MDMSKIFVLSKLLPPSLELENIFCCCWFVLKLFPVCQFFNIAVVSFGFVSTLPRKYPKSLLTPCKVPRVILLGWFRTFLCLDKQAAQCDHIEAFSWGYHIQAVLLSRERVLYLGFCFVCTYFTVSSTTTSVVSVDDLVLSFVEIPVVGESCTPVWVTSGSSSLLAWQAGCVRTSGLVQWDRSPCIDTSIPCVLFLLQYKIFRAVRLLSFDATIMYYEGLISFRYIA